MGNRKLLTGVAVMVTVGVLAGCGSTRPSAATTGQRTTTTGRQTTTTPTVAAQSPCTHSGEIRAGVLDAFRMGAIDFSSAKDGVGLTSGAFPCSHPASGGGFDVTFHRVPEQLAMTQDGGSTWTLLGRPVPVALSSGNDYGESRLVVSGDTYWVVAGKGSAFVSTDRGESWTAAPLPQPVMALESRDGYLWALSCPATRPGSCQPVVSRRSVAGPATDRWSQIALPRLKAAPLPQFALRPGGGAVLSVPVPGSELSKLFVLGSNSSRWRVFADPRWRGRPCLLAQLATSRSDIWVLCLGGAAAGSSAKALLVSTDGGSSWQVRSSVADLSKPQPSTAIPRMEPNGLIATTDLKLWMGLQNGFATSGDGGRHWSYARNVNPQGEPLIFDVVSPTQVYALAPGAGLWRTTDGTTWTAIGRLNTG